MLFRPELAEKAKAAGEGAQRLAFGARRRVVSIAVVLLIAGGLAYLFWPASAPSPSGGFGGARFGGMAVPVLVTTPRVADVPVYLDGVGAVRALNTVTVRAQVEGRLLSVNFREGQDVARGDVLAEIDPTLYKAQLDQAVAKKAQDEAQLANARLDLARYQKLAASNAGSKQQADTQAAQVAQLEALVKADQAAIDNAQAMLGYTKIVAPITGRAGLRQVDAGNIVRASDANGLVVLTQIKPIAVQFSLPQQQLARVNAAFAAAALPVEVMAGDGRGVLETGVLHSIDNQVDPATGTVKLKAEFPNASLQLWPGQFVNVRLKVETLAQALVVPTAAVQRGPVGTYAFVVGADDAVSARAVTVTQQNDTEAVIASGLMPGDRVVTTGFANLAEGSKVSVSTSTDRPAPDLAPQRRTGTGPAQDSGPAGPRGPGGKGSGKGPGGGGGPPR